MKTESLVRNAKLVARAERVVADIHLRTLVVRAGLTLAAGLFALFGAGMMALALYVVLRDAYGQGPAAVAVGASALALSAILAAVAGRTRPGRELDLARQLEEQAVEALAADVREIEAEVRGFTRVLRHPLDGALPALVLPLATLLLKSLKKPSDTGAG